MVAEQDNVALNITPIASRRSSVENRKSSLVQHHHVTESPMVNTGSPPPSQGKVLAYLIYMFMGIAVLYPWNAVLTSLDYLFQVHVGGCVRVEVCGWICAGGCTVCMYNTCSVYVTRIATHSLTMLVLCKPSSSTTHCLCLPLFLLYTTPPSCDTSPLQSGVPRLQCGSRILHHILSQQPCNFDHMYNIHACIQAHPAYCGGVYVFVAVHHDAYTGMKVYICVWVYLCCGRVYVGVCFHPPYHHTPCTYMQNNYAILHGSLTGTSTSLILLYVGAALAGMGDGWCV